MVCSGGADTPLGFFATPVNYDWRLLAGPSYGQYATRIWDSYLFHTVPYYSQHEDDIEYDQFNQLGTDVYKRQDTNKAVTGMSTTISVPVSQPDRFELGQLELSDSITLGDSASVTLNFVNKGRDALSNLEATLSGDNLGADTTVQYIGNLNAGSSNSVDFDMTPTQELSLIHI